MSWYEQAGVSDGTDETGAPGEAQEARGRGEHNGQEGRTARPVDTGIPFAQRPSTLREWEARPCIDQLLCYPNSELERPSPKRNRSALPYRPTHHNKKLSKAQATSTAALGRCSKRLSPSLLSPVNCRQDQGTSDLVHLCLRRLRWENLVEREGLQFRTKQKRTRSRFRNSKSKGGGIGVTGHKGTKKEKG